MLLISTTIERGCHVSSFLRENGGTSKRSQPWAAFCRLSVGPGQVAPLPPPSCSGPTQVSSPHRRKTRGHEHSSHPVRKGNERRNHRAGRVGQGRGGQTARKEHRGACCDKERCHSGHHLRARNRPRSFQS